MADIRNLLEACHSRLAAMESKLNENIKMTQDLIQEQSMKLEGVEKQRGFCMSHYNPQSPIYDLQSKIF